MTESILTETKDQTFPLDKNLFQPEFIEIESGFRPKALQPGDIAANVKLCIRQQWSLEKLESALQDSLWYGDQFKTPALVYVNGKQIASYSVQRNYTLNQLNEIEHEIIALIQLEEQAAAQQNPEVNFVGRWLMLRPGESVIEGLGFKVVMPNLSLLGPFSAEYRICSCRGLGAQHGINVTKDSSPSNSESEDEVKVNLKNDSNHLHFFLHGSAIAEGMMAIAIIPPSD